MRHRVSHRKLGRVTEHRIAMLRNQASALLKYEHIETTVPKAKELRPFVERIITIAKRGLAAGDSERQDAARAAPGPSGHPGSRRREQAVRHDRAALRNAAGRLHAHPAARLSPRRQRRGRADRARRQRVRSERRGREGEKRGEVKKPKGVGGRLRAAAAAPARQEGRAGEGEAAEDGSRRRPSRPARRASQPSPTRAARPRRPADAAKSGRQLRRLWALELQALEQRSVRLFASTVLP